ncbi:hypothetical protein ACFVT8_02515 [Lysinibacillus sp. NPDC058147]|uniref:hypothetical protein n=1 Tax=unclassified Lysinibacillus TaxID=2636778 RepID=UPI0036DC3F9C
MEQEVNQHTILQAILELSKQMQDMKSDLQNQIEAVEKRLDEKIEAVETRLEKVEQNLSRKIDLVDAKFEILSLDLLTTKAEVSMLKQVR